MANTLTVHNPEIWSKYLLKNFDAASVMLGLVNKQLEAEFAAGGDKLHRHKIGGTTDVTVSNYTAGSDISVGDVASSETDLDIDQKKYFAFHIDATEMRMATNKVDLVKEYAKRGSIIMAQTVDTFLLAKSSDVDSGNVIGSASLPVTITPDNIYDYFVEAGEMLDSDNIAPDGRTAVIDPTMKSAILRSPDFIKATAMGDSVVRSGKIGEMAGFDVVVSNRIATASGVKDIMFARFKDFLDFAALISPEHTEPLKLPLQFGMGIKGLMLYGGKVFHPTAGVVLKKAA